MVINVENFNVTQVLTQPCRIQILVGQTQSENLDYFNYFGQNRNKLYKDEQMK
jgi:hypothetical protein